MEFVVSRSELSYSEDALSVELTDDPMDPPKEVLEGSPVVASEMLSVGISEGGLVVARGILRCTPGKYKDVVDDEEFFTVISGRATLEVVSSAGSSNVAFELVEGTVGELRKGVEVIYTVHETLLKSFQLIMSGDDEGEGEESKKQEIASEHNFASSSYAVLAASVALQPEEMQEGQSWASDPAPAISSTLLSTLDQGLVLRGLWRCGQGGSCTYVEQDELFTVLQGTATVTVRRGGSATPISTGDIKEGADVKTMEERVLVLSKGMVGEFKQGDVATFVVEGGDFLKSFQITGAAPAAL